MKQGSQPCALSPILLRKTTQAARLSTAISRANLPI
jgi:hypothetical protein